ncbi:MAG: PAS domain S-box protein [Paludibacter sp.]|nr:PAS domain S-box protein [Paludibacter sp.]
MKPSNTSVADQMRQEAEKLASIKRFDTTKDLTKEDALLQMRKLELRVSELELENQCLLQTIEQQKQKKTTLRKNETFLQSIIKTIPDLIWLKDVAGSYMACNSIFERFFGAKEADIIGKTDYDYLDKELADFFRNRDKIAMNAGIPTINEEWITFADDGHKVFLETIKTPMYDADKKLIGVLGIGRDITLRKEAETKLHEQEVQYHNLANSGLALIWTSGTDKLCNYFNQTWLNFTGSTLEQEIGNGWTESVYPEDLDQCIDTYITAFEKQEAFQMEYRLRHHSGEYRWILDMGTPNYNKDGEFIGYIGNCFDIDERKLIENALKASEEKFKNVFDNSIIGKSITTLDNQLHVNAAFRKIIGYSEVELKSKSWQDITFQEDIQHNAELLKKILSGEINSARFEKRFIHKNGSLVWVDLSTTLLRDDNNTPLFYITEIIDITERKNAQFALQDSNERLSLILENSPIAIWDWDLETDKWFATQKYYSMLGYEPESGYPDRSVWLSRIHPDDRKQVQIKIENVLERTGEAYAYDARMLHADGTYRWHSVIGQVVERNPDGKTKRMLGVRVDINERKYIEEKLRESEGKLSALFASMTEMVAMHELVFDQNGNAVNYLITDCNAAFTNITGIERQNAIGKLGTEVYGTTDAPYLEQYAQVAITGESKEFDSFFAPMDKHFLISVIAPERNKFATISTDVTTLQQIQQQILIKNKELEDYLYIASHDLRSPLVNIQGFSQRLQKQTDKIKYLLENCETDPVSKLNIDKVTTEEIPKTLDFIFSSVIKMETLINGLLQLSRTGRIKMHNNKVDMNKLIAKVVATHNFQISESSGNVNVENLPDCYGDDQQLNQLFSNLLSNAIKYRDKNKQLQIKISATNAFNKIIYIIADNGIGIDSRYQEKIWNIFYRTHPQSQIPGDGVGLSVVKQIAERHYGKVWVESEEGQGSTFFVELQKNNWE